MKSKLFYLISFLVILTSLGFAESKMNLPVNVFDFGFVPQQSQATCRFWIYSAGADTLHIIDVRPGCGCTKAPLEKKIIPPGDSTYVDITFNTGQYKGRTSKSITISAADSVPAQHVTILSTVYPDTFVNDVLSIKPAILELTGTAKGQEVKFTIENKTSEEVMPALSIIPEGLIEIYLPKSIPPGKIAEGKIKTISEIPLGFAKSFTFNIGDSEQAIYTVPIKGKPVGQSAKAPLQAVKPK